MRQVILSPIQLRKLRHRWGNVSSQYNPKCRAGIWTLAVKLLKPSHCKCLRTCTSQEKLTELIRITAHCLSHLKSPLEGFLHFFFLRGRVEVVGLKVKDEVNGRNGWWVCDIWKTKYCFSEWLWNLFFKPLYFTCIGVSQFQLKQRWVVLVPLLPHGVFEGIKEHWSQASSRINRIFLPHRPMSTLEIHLLGSG